MFPVDVNEVSHSVSELSSLVNDLMDELRCNSERIVYGKAEVDQFYVAPCKPIIDEIESRASTTASQKRSWISSSTTTSSTAWGGMGRAEVS